MKTIMIVASAALLSGCLNSIPTDKKYHIVGGVAVAGVAKAAGLNNRQACLASIVVGVAKEVYDAQHPATHSVELADAVATAAVCIPLLIADRQTYKGPRRNAVVEKPKSKIVGRF